jgi:hypothetical protein
VTPPEPGRSLRWTVFGIGRVVVFRPGLWWAALGALRRLAAPGWWRRRPHLPLPDDRLWGFRMVTAYGSAGAIPEPEDVISYLEWCRSTRVRGRVHHRRTATLPWANPSAQPGRAKFPG